MREALKELINQTILFRYKLPNEQLKLGKSHLTGSSDYDSCYEACNNEQMASVIYNAVVEYAFNEFELTEADFDKLHRRALTRKLKFNESASEDIQVKYGFYGEVILYCMLYFFYKAPPAIARGHFYQILENGETKGYDAYHIINNQGSIELWFGEVKFYGRFSDATTGTNGAITNLEKVITDDYLNKNLIAVSERFNDLSDGAAELKPILDEIRRDPLINIQSLAIKHKIKLVYPILILFDGHKDGFDRTIESAIKHLEKRAKKIEFNLSIELSLFFIFVPVQSGMEIKLKVLEWIKEAKPLM